MARARRILSRLRNLFRTNRAEKELEREVASRLVLLADDFERRGMSPEEARLAAKRAYGGLEQAKQAHRDERSLLWIEHLVQDLRYALRMWQNRQVLPPLQFSRWRWGSARMRCGETSIHDS